MPARRPYAMLATLAAALALLVGMAPAARAQVPTVYASCTECHTLSLSEAQGMMAEHSGYLVPQAPEQACGFCHSPPVQHGTSFPPYWWTWPLNPYPYPYPGEPSVTVQTCNGCHGTTAPPPSSHHPSDTIPYVNQTTSPPPASSILPLYNVQGFQSQDPYSGGMTCATCHDPHEPGAPDPGTGKSTFTRIVNDGFTSRHCTWCHSDQELPPSASDLSIDRTTSSVTFSTVPGTSPVLIVVTIRNGGNAPGSGTLAVLVEEPGTAPLWIGGAPIPYVAPNGSAVVTVPWDTWGLTQDVALHFSIDNGAPQPLNPYRSRVFIRTYPYVPPAIVPPPANLTVVSQTSDGLELSWTAPAGYTGPLTYNVFRDGVQVNTSPVVGGPYGVSYPDGPLSPETPHTYTVQAVTPDRLSSQMSNHAGGTTGRGTVIRVPQDVPTIQQAIAVAYPGTSILVAPGTYPEAFNFSGKSGISVIGQDPEGCVIDLTGTGFGFIDLDPGPSSANSLQGFTVVGGTVFIGPGDTVANCVFRGSPYDSVGGSGLVTNCVFDQTSGYPAISVFPDEFMTVANSLFLGHNPIWADPAGGVYLLHNAFASTGFEAWPGEGNFPEWPAFLPPGPPETYVIENGQCIDRGFPVGLPQMGLPDVGAFEFGIPYTPQPPADLAAVWDGAIGGIRLTWTLSPGDPQSPYPLGQPVAWYAIYRSETPDVSLTNSPYASRPYGTDWFVDASGAPGKTYYYQVRAVAPAFWPLDEVISLPTNTAAATVLPGNAAPTLSTIGPRSGAEGGSFSIPLSATDPDPEDTLTFSVSGRPPFCTVTDFGSGDGVIACNPGYSDAGSYDVTVTVTDNGSPVASDSETFTLAVTNVNRLPVALNDSRTGTEDQTLTVPAPGVLANDSDLDGDALTAVIVTYAAHGSVSLSANGSFYYWPVTNYNGTDAFTYRVSDGSGSSSVATVTITVAPVNDAPTAGTEAYGIAEDAVLSVPTPGVLANDSDVDGDTIYLLVTMPPLHGTFVFDQNGSFTYTPHANFSGMDSFKYRATDGRAGSNEIQVLITVNPRDDAPVLAPIGGQTVAEGATLQIPLAATDPDAMDTLTFAAAGLPGFCTLTGNPNRTGSIACTPGYSDAGSYAVTVTVSDNGSPVASDSETFTLTVTNVNREPQVTNPGSQSSGEGAAVSLPIVASDPDGDTLSFSAAGLPPGLAINAATGVISGTLSFTSAGTHPVTVTVSDGAAASGAIFTWSVADVPLIRVESIAMGVRPVKGNTQYTAKVRVLDDRATPVAGAAVTGHWTGSGADPAPTTLITLITLTTAADGTTEFATAGIRRPSGVYVFSIDSVVKAGCLYDLANSVTSSQYPPPAGSNPPVANPDSASTTSGTPVTIAVLANDTDPDGDALTIATLTQPAHGTAAANGAGTVTYTPAAGFTGSDTFTYTASDGTLASSPATVTVAVAAPPAGGKMHVAAIDMSITGKRPAYKAVASVRIVDDAGAPVAGATVACAWTGAVTGTASGVTGTDGRVSFTSGKEGPGKTFTFTVTDLAMTAWTYDDAANVETTDSITAP